MVSVKSATLHDGSWLGSRGLVAKHAVLLLALVAVVVLLSLGQVWAYTISPNPPVAGQPFTITASNPSDLIIVGGFCFNGGVTGFMTAVQGSITLTLPAGQYSFEIPSEGVACTLFTVESTPPPTPSSYVPPATIGGTMLPLNQLQVLLPWIVLITLLGTLSVWTLIVKRERRSN